MKLAVYFPGIGYNCSKPLLYYAREIACQSGYTQYITLTYTDHTKNIKGNDALILSVLHNLYHQAEQLLNDIDWSKYDDILFISKSIGTAVAAYYAQQHQISCRNVYYTPLNQTFQFPLQPGIAFSGTCDSWVNHELLMKQSKEADIPLYLIKDANHSLEIDNVLQNIEHLKLIMKQTEIYIRKTI